MISTVSHRTPAIIIIKSIYDTLQVNWCFMGVSSRFARDFVHIGTDDPICRILYVTDKQIRCDNYYSAIYVADFHFTGGYHSYIWYTHINKILLRNFSVAFFQ